MYYKSINRYLKSPKSQRLPTKAGNIAAGNTVIKLKLDYLLKTDNILTAYDLILFILKDDLQEAAILRLHPLQNHCPPVLRKRWQHLYTAGPKVAVSRIDA